jgi:hypothetical protein
MIVLRLPGQAGSHIFRLPGLQVTQLCPDFGKRRAGGDSGAVGGETGCLWNEVGGVLMAGGLWEVGGVRFLRFFPGSAMELSFSFVRWVWRVSGLPFSWSLVWDSEKGEEAERCGVRPISIFDRFDSGVLNDGVHGFGTVGSGSETWSGAQDRQN